MAKSLRRKLKQIGRAGALSAEERVQQILDERTERLAARADTHAQSGGETVRVLICGAGRERFGIAAEAVAEVLPSRGCIPIPNGPPALVGVFGRGGLLVNVIDLAVALGLEPAPAEDESRHLVLLRREQPQVALRVDRAHAVSDVSPLAGDQTGGFRNDAVTGHAKTPYGPDDRDAVVSLLDTDRLLRPFLSPSVPGV